MRFQKVFAVAAGAVLAASGCGDRHPTAPAAPRAIEAMALGDSARFVSQDVPAEVAPGTAVRVPHSVSVTMTNAGTTVWTRGGGYKLGSQSPQDNETWYVQRVQLPRDSVRPGETVTFTFNIYAPGFPGNYNFQWKMVREYVHWFGQPSPLRSIRVDWPGEAIVSVRDGLCLTSFDRQTCQPGPAQQWVYLVDTGKLYQTRDDGNYCIQGPTDYASDAISIRPCDWIPEQEWIYLSGGQIALRADRSLCLDATEDFSPMGVRYTVIRLLRCNRSDAQLWRRSTFGYGGSTVSARLDINGGCLTVPDGTTKAATATCDVSDARQRIVRNPQNEMRIADRCLEATWSSVVLSLCDGGPDQKWDLDAKGRLVERSFGYCMRPKNGVTTVGTEIIIDPCNLSANTWTYRDRS